MKNFFKSLYYVATVDNRNEEDNEEREIYTPGVVNDVLYKLCMVGVAVILILQCVR